MQSAIGLLEQQPNAGPWVMSDAAVLLQFRWFGKFGTEQRGMGLGPKLAMPLFSTRISIDAGQVLSHVAPRVVFPSQDARRGHVVGVVKTWSARN